jgi:ribosomal protein S18 acetylase RimI-like enzyme
MPRTNLRVRPAEPRDVDVLVALVREHRETVVGWAYRLPRTSTDTRVHYLRLLSDRSRRLVVVVDGDGGAVVGMAVFTVDVVSALSAVPSVAVSHLLVAPAHRHRGAGRALLSAATGYADEVGAEHVIVAVDAGGRDANRFLARLGFAPLVLRRIAPVVTLRRTLGDPLGSRRQHLPRRGAVAGATRARLRRLS